MSIQTQLVIYQCQTTGHDLVSTECQYRPKLVIYQCKTTGYDLVSSECQCRHKLEIYQCQTTGHDLVSSECQYSQKLVVYQCQTTGHDLVSSECQCRPKLDIYSGRRLYQYNENYFRFQFWLACVCIDIQSRQDRVQWCGIAILLACDCLDNWHSEMSSWLLFIKFHFDVFLCAAHKNTI